MRVYRGLCVVLTAAFVLIAVPISQPLRAGSTDYLCGDGYYHYSCKNYDGWKCQDGRVATSPGNCVGHGGVVSRFRAICGDGIGDIGEQCDQGSNNSDNRANACRTDCRFAYCGDYVKDNGEQCDSRHGNSNSPNNCRESCALPVCGDGIRDDGSYESMAFNEECDDGNDNDLDGCKRDCTSCVQLTENIEVSSNIKLCAKVFNVADYGDEGVIIVKRPGVIIDCDGATLMGSGVGAGIFVKMSNDVEIRNCTISGYAAGLKAVNSQNVSVRWANNFALNTKAIVLENSSRSVTLQSGQQNPGKLPSTQPARPTNSGTPSRSVPPTRVKTAPTVKSAPRVKTATVVKIQPRGRVVVEGKRTYLSVNVAIASADIYAGSRRLGRLPGSKRLDISRYVPRAVKGVLVVHYFDSKGVKTIQKIKVK